MSLLRSNLLKKALKLIPKESFIYYRFIEDSINDFGIKTPLYQDPIIVKGSVQSPENSLYQQLGLSFEKNYKIFYGDIKIQGNEAQSQPDKILYDNKTFDVIKNTNWYNYDGWCGVLTVEVKREIPQSS